MTTEQKALITEIVNKFDNQDVNLKVLAETSKINYPSQLGDLTSKEIEGQMINSCLGG